LRVAEEVNKSAGSMRAVDRVVAILELFQGSRELTMSEVANATGLNLSTTFRYLGALAEHGWLVAQPSGSYRLSIRVFQWGQSVVANLDFSRVSRPYMEALLREYGETVNCAIYQSGAVVVIESLESSSAIRRGASVGEQDFLFSSGLGKSILACLPKEEVLRLQAGVELKPITERTITSLDELLEDLELVRTRGYSLDDEESEVGLMCVAGAIHDHHGFPRYAISVSGPTERIRSALECGLGESVASAVSAVSRDLGNFTATSQF
jgi:IclR family acetate operon transcriptional repressor